MRRFVSLFFAARIYLLVTPTALMFTGAAMNQVVIVANGGKMPVQVNDRSAQHFGFEKDGMADIIHVRMSSKTKFNWLADYVNLKVAILSPGDLLIYLANAIGGYAVAIWGALLINDLARLRKA